MSEDKLKITVGAMILTSAVIAAAFVCFWILTGRLDRQPAPQQPIKLNCICTSIKEPAK